MKINPEIIRRVRSRVFSCSGRLLDRKMFSCFFDGGSKNDFIDAVLAYRNSDGGFGNGIEPDLQTPDSTGIGAETALYYFYIAGELPEAAASGITGWIENNMQENGTLAFPPASLADYPHQLWWENPDEKRILAVIALLIANGVSVPGHILEKTNRFAESYLLPETISEYDYPIYLYSLYVKSFKNRQMLLQDLWRRFEDLNTRKKDMHLLFNRYWFFFHQLFNTEAISSEAGRFLAAIEKTGSLENLFAGLPWWDTILTLDGLVILQKSAQPPQSQVDK